MISRRGTLFKATMLVAGTSIGGGMLAAPVLMASSGFLPSLLVYLACWAFMAGTGLLLLEVCLWMRRESNLVSMAGRTLGPVGKMASWGMYLFLFYCLTLAYVVGGGELVAEMLADTVSTGTGAVVFVAIFGSMVFLGPHLVGRTNLPLMLGLGASYLAFVVLGYYYIKPEFLWHRNWREMAQALPIAFTAFGYQGIIPTLVTYLDHDAVKLRRAILMGTLIPLAVYVVWQGLILGVVPLEGPHGLLEAREHGLTAVRPLRDFIGNPYVYLLGECFAFFALTTSFLGVTLGLLDFLADGFQLEKTSRQRAFLCLAIFVPPLVISQLYPEIFLDALSYAGGIGVAFLLGLLPILMVWSGRYRLGIEGQRMLGGGKPVLLLLIMFVVCELALELAKLLTG